MTDAEVLELWHSGDYATLAEQVGKGITVTVVEDIYFNTDVHRTEVELDDLISVGYLLMLECIPEWEPDTGVPLRTFISQQVRWRIKDHIREATTQKRGGDQERAPEIPEDVRDSFTEDQLIHNIDLRRALDYLTDTQRACLQASADGATLREIGAELGISHVMVRNHLMEARRVMEAVLAD